MRRPTLLLAGLAVLSLAALLPSSADGQIRASEPSTFVQDIDGTQFRIDYYRPRTRGRAPLFGPNAVVWEHIWTPGANWATKLSVNRDVELGGVAVPEGIYSVWIEMDEDMMPHELFLEPDTLIFHTEGPARTDEQISIPLTMENDAPFVEVMRWDFEDISSTGGVLALRWGTHRFAWDVKVQPSMAQTVAEGAAAPALGTYDVWMFAPDGQEMGPMTMAITRDEHGHMMADISGAPPNPDGSPSFFDVVEIWLLPANAEGWFMPGEAYDHVLRETWAGSFMEFDLGDEGSYPSFLLRDDIDRPFMRGQRRR